MADDDTQAPEDPAAAPEPQAASGLDARMDRIEAQISELANAITGGGGRGSESAPEPPANVAHEIRQQLDERDRRDAAAAEDKAKTDRLGAVETRLAELTEKPPGPPPRRVEKIMGWR